MKLSDLRKHSAPPHDLDPDNVDVQETLRSFLSAMGKDPDNLYQELEMDSRFVDTRRDATPHPDASVQLHSHGFYELIYCRTSCGVEYLLGAERFRLLRGDVVIVPPGVSHRPIFPKDMSEAYKRYVLWISEEFMDLFFSLLPSPEAALSSSGIIRTAGTQWATLRELFQKGVIEAEQKAPGWEASVCGNTMVLLSQLERAVGDRSAPFIQAEKPELLDILIAYIESHLDQKLTLSDVAERFYISESTISHLFRNKMGTSFHRLVIQRRLVAAKGLIVNGVALEEVAARIGFGDYSTFYRAFRSEYGITPRQFRSMREDTQPAGI